MRRLLDAAEIHECKMGFFCGGDSEGDENDRNMYLYLTWLFSLKKMSRRSQRTARISGRANGLGWANMFVSRAFLVAITKRCYDKVEDFTIEAIKTLIVMNPSSQERFRL